MVNNRRGDSSINERKDSVHIKSFRERIAKLRTQKNDSQDTIAKKLEVARQTIAKYETFNSKSLPDVEKFCKLCEQFKVTPNYLLGYSNIMCDDKPNCGLTDKTINYLHQNPNIHDFINYFVEQLVVNELESVISKIGTENNYETAWERVFPKKIINAVNSAFDNITKSAKFSCDICVDKMETALQKEITFQAYESIFEKMDANAKGFILGYEPNYWKLDREEKYNVFIKALCDIFFEVKLVQIIYKINRENAENKFLEIIDNYVKTFKVREEK